jgi:flagellar biosynthesis protein FliP
MICRMRAETIHKYLIAAAVVIVAMLFATAPVFADPLSLPNISLNVGGSADSPGKTAGVIQLLFILTVLTLAPSILLMMTSFTRIIIVLGLLRQAMGTASMPPNQIVVGLSLFLTLFIMTPVWQKVNNDALKPYYGEQISGEQAFTLAMAPVKEFMMKQTREKDLALFIKISKEKRPETPADISLSVLIPSFIISELKTAFQIGFMVFLPFFVIDMVVSSILLSMGMMMLPPMMVSLPFKLLLFVLVDGWYLIIGSLVQSFH